MTTHEDYARTAHFVLENPGGDELILLLHGLGATHSQPLALLPDYRSKKCAVLAVDLRAHGETPLIGEPEDFSFAALIADVAALVRHVGQADKRTHLVGISMGAAIALQAALTRAISVVSLALIRPAFDDHPVPDNLRVMSLIGAILSDSDGDKGKDLLAGTSEYRAVAAISPLGAASLMRQFDDPLATERSVRLRSVPKNIAYSSLAELGQIDVPTLVIGADRDPVHPLELARSVAGAIRTSEFVTVPPRDDDPSGHATATARRVQRHLHDVVPRDELTVGDSTDQLTV